MNRLLIGAADKTNLLLQLLREAFPGGVTLIDPAGVLARAAANIIPTADTQRTVYLDPSDLDHPVGLNVLRGLAPDAHQPFTEHLAAYMEAVWPTGWGPQSNFIFSLCIRLLLCAPDPTLVGILRLLTDLPYRNKCLTRCRDPVVRAGWQFIQEQSQRDKRWWANAIAPLMNKVGTLLMSPLIRNIVGQKSTTFRSAGTIVIADLDRAKLGDLTAKLLGGLLLFAGAGEMFINDFGFFASEEGLGSFLSQGRFTVALSYLDELPPRLRQQVLGIEDKYIFRTNKRDADELAFHVGLMNPRILTELAPNEVRIQTGVIVPERPSSPRRLNALRRRTRAAHTRPREKVERIIDAFFSSQ